MAENAEHLSGDYLQKMIPKAKAAATMVGLPTTDVGVAPLVDSRFVDAVNQ
jgi:hypothetical protein